MPIQPPRPGVKYTQRQIELMRAAYPDFRMPGHVIRYDDDGTVSFVKWDQASYTGEHEPGTVQELNPNRYFSGQSEWNVTPIKKRTPQERLESLANSWMEDVKKAGRLPGVDDETTRNLVGESWRAGRPFTAEDVRAAAATMLGQADNKFEASERKKVVRTAPSD